MMRLVKPSLKFLILSPLLLLAGCQIFGIFARALPNNVSAAYTGLKGNDVAILVWTDRATTLDWPAMTIDITAGTQKKLRDAQTNDKPEELEGTTFPVTPQSIARFQLDHPEDAMLPITEIAPKVGVRRLIYVEVTNFQTHSDQSINNDMFRGQLSANIRVVEYDKVKGTTKIAYEENKVVAKYPPKAPSDGEFNIGDQRTYIGTIDQFTTTLAQRFYKHEEEQE